MSMHTIGDEGTYEHQDDEEGEDHQADIQWGSECLVKDWIYQPIIGITGIDFGIKVNM